MAAVNDITAREEQFQSYLTQNKSETNKNDYFSKLNSNETMNIDCITSKSIIENPLLTVSIATSERNDLFMNSCDSPINEFVDINEMEFIQKKNDDKIDKNLILRRSHRKKTTKRKDEECNFFLFNFTYDIQIFHKF